MKGLKAYELWNSIHVLLQCRPPDNSLAAKSSKDQIIWTQPLQRKKNPFEVSHHPECRTMNVSGNKATKFLKVMAVPIPTLLRGETLRYKKPACMRSFYGWPYENTYSHKHPCPICFPPIHANNENPTKNFTFSMSVIQRAWF